MEHPIENYPPSLVPATASAPCPRRVRGVFAGQTIFDTVDARYVWERAPYPQFYIPVKDIAFEWLVDENRPEQLKRGAAQRYGLRVGDQAQPGVAHVYGDGADDIVAGLVKFEWAGLDGWFEEDEQVFVHPRNPYVRVDAIRARRHVRVEHDGAVLAESSSVVLVFETGLTTRYYFDRTAVDFTELRPTDTQTACPYKGVTSGYWASSAGATEQRDLAWTYDFPTAGLSAIAGLVAFFDERVDLTLDGVRQDRPRTHYS